MSWLGFIIIIISVYFYYQKYEWAIVVFIVGLIITAIGLNRSEKKTKYEIRKTEEEKEPEKTETDSPYVFKDSEKVSGKVTSTAKEKKPEENPVYFSRGIRDVSNSQASKTPSLESVDIYHYTPVSNLWKCPYCDGEISSKDLQCPICKENKRG